MILGFNQSIQSRLNDCEKALTQIKPKLDQNKLAKTQNKLGLVLGALNRANQRIRAHAAEHAMKELQNATDTLNEGIEEIKNGYGKVLGEINRMKARAWSMKGTEAIIRRWGLNPATVQEKIGELEQKIDDATDLVTEGKVGDAFKLLGKGWEWFPHFARAHMPWSFNRNSIGR